MVTSSLRMAFRGKAGKGREEQRSEEKGSKRAVKGQ